MNTQKKARSLYWDIVKGWGIIAIVLGHTGYFAGAFVYLFHLALFFFITGYFYNETKYGDTPFLYFGSRPQLFCNAQALCGTGTLQPYQNAYGMDEQSFLQLPGTGSGCPLVSAGLAGVLRTLCRMCLVWTRCCPLHPER